MIKWFLCINQKISGPFTLKDIENLSEHNDLSLYLFWSKTLTEWKPYSWWRKNSKNSIMTSTVNQKLQTWYFAKSNQSFGPYSRKELVAQLKTLTHLDNVLIWTDGLPNWIPLYDFNDIIMELGINRRQHKRVPVNGKVQIQINEFLITNAQLATLSEGGCGLVGASSLRTGQRVKLKIESQELPSPILVDAEVRYMTGEGFVGIQFEKMHSEVKSTIVSFVNSSKRNQAA